MVSGTVGRPKCPANVNLFVWVFFLQIVVKVASFCSCIPIHPTVLFINIFIPIL